MLPLKSWKNYSRVVETIIFYFEITNHFLFNHLPKTQKSPHSNPHAFSQSTKHFQTHPPIQPKSQSSLLNHLTHFQPIFSHFPIQKSLPHLLSHFESTYMQHIYPLIHLSTTTGIHQHSIGVWQVGWRGIFKRLNLIGIK